VFFGRGIGALGIISGELCFNTGMTGYQETLTDPSYCDQIITFTFPHIGNVGANAEDAESRAVFASGLIVREPITQASNFRTEEDFSDWLIRNRVTGISGVDTRRLTRLIRDKGVQNAAIGFYASAQEVDIPALLQIAQARPTMEGCELAQKVTCKAPYLWKEGVWESRQLSVASCQKNDSQTSNRQLTTDNSLHVIALDYGIKRNILRHLVSNGCRVTVVPADTSAETILALNPDGIFLSNGPGDPAATGVYALPVLRTLIDTGLPIFGICLGHQLLALALGGRTAKMDKGHRGCNQPVQDTQSGIVEITSQNHGFVVVEDSLPPEVIVSHRSLFDGSVEGLAVRGKPIFSVQHHPEASPGPTEASRMFGEFVAMMEAHRVQDSGARIQKVAL
jgi:carbamoyl-phosphate synthase small subunit